jgi:BirA family biotin operon repressor/biotin-[acetyl-CoA-carboxylase] ligase
VTIPNLKTKIIAKKIYYFESIDSTNLYAENLIKNEKCAGCELIIAGSQTHGKGRLSRTWVSPKGGNLYFSLILKPNLKDLATMPVLTLLASLTLVNVLKIYHKIDAMIKWPNDVLIGNKKISGILAKSETIGNITNFVIIGIGINLNINPACVDSALKDLASCIRELANINYIDEKIFLGNFLNHFEKNYSTFINSKNNFISEIKSHTNTLNRMIKFNYNGKEICGKAYDITNYGELVIQLENNQKILLNTGDIYEIS